MLNLMQNKPRWGARLQGVLAAFVLAASGAASAAPVTVDLCATSGTVSLPVVLPGSPTPTTSPVNIFGYVLGDCSVTSTAGAPGGPVIDINVGDVVTVILHNNLTEATGLLFQGQGMVPDTTGVQPLAASAPPYTFTAANPGTFLYEAAVLPNAQHQTAMGLYGALIVRPTVTVTATGVSIARTDAATVTATSAEVLDAGILSTDVGSVVSGTGIPPGATITVVTPNTSFTMSAAATAAGTAVVVTRADGAATITSGSDAVTDTAVLSTDAGSSVTGSGIAAGTTITAVTAGASFTMSAAAAAATGAYGASTVFNDQAVLVLSEIDPALNANPVAFDMRNYAPKYFLINGKAYPETTTIPSAAGNKVLLRYVNAGIKHHSMAVLGLRQVFVAKDASTLPTLNHNVAAETLAPGQTGDAIATIPAVTSESKFAVYDASLLLHNSNAPGLGGMLTFVTAGTTAAGDTTGPTTSAVTLTPNKTNGTVDIALNASVSDVASGNANVISAEYFVDASGAGGTGTPRVP